MKELNLKIDKKEALLKAIDKLMKFEGSNIFGSDYFAQSRALLDLIEFQRYKVLNLIQNGHLYSDVGVELIDSLEALHTSARILLGQISEEDFDAISELLNNTIENINTK
ncbi:hypothetical protein [Capnocytophaga sputigena]|jgi:hypothetical protein|nr:MAG TPA: hypothetical protein [Caudoviricetes sp.]